MLRRTSALITAAGLCVLVALAGAHAAGRRHHATKRARVHGLVAPTLLTPGNGSRVEQIPTLTWGGVAGASEYEYQLSADPRFNSIAIGSGPGTGTSITHNLAGALGKSTTDGTYYWRVRALTSAKNPGPWSATRSLVKAWSAAPQLLGPPSGADVTWPSLPLVLSWSAVPDATEYIVSIATDQGLSNLVLGSGTSPQTTVATVFALPRTLAAGQYYWAITPVDAEGHRGTRSAVGTFNWSWPTTTATQVSDLNADPRVFDPQFTWAPVPGAARYEVEVNSAAEFPVGSKWCCEGLTTGTSLSPTHALANNGYYWRVRAIDAAGNAGVWNVGAPFEKAFDSVTPTIPNLTMSDASGNQLPAGATTDAPLVTWSPVPGAASYEVQVTRYVPEFGCNWAATRSNEKQTVDTSSLAWAPLGPDSNHIGPTAWPGPRTSQPLDEGNIPYCVRVLARSDNDAMGNQVVSNWTQIGGVNRPAFSFASQPAPGSPGPEGLVTPPSAYIQPGGGSTQPRTPLFTWQRVPGASLYYVVIARDAGFTHVVDVASTVVPAYAPPLDGEEPLDDETSAYYWAVVPVNAKGEEFSDPSQGQDAPQSFNKSSVPPAPLGPASGATVENQPTFSWTPAEGALNYTLQVSQDPTFGNPIDNVRTDSTAFTSSSTYPADVTLYWRVRANDTNSRNEGLNWSPVRTFRRTLPVPTPSPGVATTGQGIPVRTWAPVLGAIAYEVHVEQPDGTTKDFTFPSTAFTPTLYYGTGIWRWQVRALFPSSGFGSVTGGYSARQPFIRTLAPPTGVVGTKAGSQITLSWSPDQYAKQYEVDFSTSETFTSTLESRRIDGLSWAPDIDLTQAGNKGNLYWRVAAVDQGGNVGPFTAGSFVPPRPKPRCVVKRFKKGKKTVKRCVVPKHHAKKKHR
jgi:hypothetical protein